MIPLISPAGPGTPVSGPRGLNHAYLRRGCVLQTWPPSQGWPLECRDDHLLPSSHSHILPSSLGHPVLPVLLARFKSGASFDSCISVTLNLLTSYC